MTMEEYISKTYLLEIYEQARKEPAISFKKIIEEAPTIRRSHRFQTLTVDDIIDLIYPDTLNADPPYCGSQYIEEPDGMDEYICPEGVTCRECLRTWLEEEAE